MADDILNLRKQIRFGGGSTKVGSNRSSKHIYDDLFDPKKIPLVDGSIDSIPEDDDPESDILGYKPETEASERFKQLLSEYPEHQSPGFGDRVTAGLLGVGNALIQKDGNTAKIQEDILEGGNQRRMSDWEKKIRPAEVASSQENQRNVNARQMAGYELRDDQANKRIESQERIAGEKARIATEKNKILQDANRYKRLGWKIEKAGSEIVALANPDEEHPAGQRIVLGSSNMMDQIDLEELRNTGRVAAAEAAGTNQQNLETTRQKGRPFQLGGKTYIIVDGEPVEVNLPKGELTKPGTPARPSAATGGTLESRRVEQDKMKDLYELDPVARSQMTYKGGTYAMKTRPVIGQGGLFGYGGATEKDQQMWDEVKKHIDPSYVPPAAPKAEAPSTPTQRVTPSNNTPIGPTIVPSTAPSTERNQLPNRPPPSNWGVTPPAKQGSPLEQKAAEFLRTNKQAVTPANIQHAIQQGWVK